MVEFLVLLMLALNEKCPTESYLAKSVPAAFWFEIVNINNRLMVLLVCEINASAKKAAG
jgi:hypothetical protein